MSKGILRLILVTMMTLLLVAPTTVQGQEDVIDVSVDIQPGRCPDIVRMSTPYGSQFTVAILGSETFDVSQVDLTTVRLQGVAAKRCSLPSVDVATPWPGDPPNGDPPPDCGVQGPDGYLDQTCLFLEQEVVNTLGAVVPGDTREVMLTGKLLAAYGGLNIRGPGWVMIGPISPPPELPPPPPVFE